MSSAEEIYSGHSPAEFHRLPVRSLKAMYVSKGIIAVASLLIAIVAVLCMGRIAAGFENLFSAIVLLLLSVIIIYCMVSPAVYYRHYAYSIDDEKLDVRSGVVFLSHTLIPVERIHQVEINRGPIDRAFGLADVTVTTAGGVFSMPHLDGPEADSIASKLNEVIVSMLKARARWTANTAIILSFFLRTR